MKKTIYLLTVFVLILFAACEKEENNSDTEEDNNNEETENKIKPEDLVGNWDFVSLMFEGFLYTSCDPYLTDDYNYVTLNFYDVTETEMRFYNECDNYSHVYEYTIEENIIICGDNSREFQIMNYDTFEGDTLELKLIEPSNYTNIPIGGIYTVAKQ